MRRRLNATNIMFDYVDPQIYRDSIKFLKKYNVLCFPDVTGYIKITPKDRIIISPSKGSELIMRPKLRVVNSNIEKFLIALEWKDPVNLHLKEGYTIKEGRRTFQIYLKTPYEDDRDRYFSKMKFKK